MSECKEGKLAEWTIYSPHRIEILIHIYVISEPLWFDTRDNSDIADFLDKELIVEDKKSKCGYRCTGRGDALVKMLCKTPLPTWSDPRDSQEKRPDYIFAV